MVPTRAVSELYHRHANVLGLQIVVELLACGAIHLFHFVAHHPTQKVDAVDALVHEASAILFPRAPPRRLIVISLVPVPTNMDAAVGYLPETPLFKRPARLLHRHVESILMAGGNRHATILRTRDNEIRIGDAHGHGLLDDNDSCRRQCSPSAIAACLPLSVAMATSSYVRVIGKHGAIIRVAGDRTCRPPSHACAKKPLHLLGSSISQTATRFEPVVLGGKNMVGGNAAAADNGAFHFAISCLCSNQHFA